MGKIIIVKGDITKQNTDAIVNSANVSLLPGSGVSGVVHKAAGKELERECLAIKETLHKGRLGFGEAIITRGYSLPAKFIIHAAGPVWRGGKNNEEQILERTYFNALEVSYINGVKSIAFPSISTGIHRFPFEKSARIALETFHKFLQLKSDFEEIRMVLLTDGEYGIYQTVYEKFKNSHGCPEEEMAWIIT